MVVEQSAQFPWAWFIGGAVAALVFYLIIDYLWRKYR